MHALWIDFKSWLARRGGLVVAVVALFLLTAATSQVPSTGVARAASIATLHHDPHFILQAVARRMGVRLLPEIPEPTVLLESGTSPSRWSAAAERQWGFRPGAFASFFASAENEIYLIDDAATHARRRSTLDDALAHELAHYLQARYRKDALGTDWAELEAVAVQGWFRAQYMEPERVATP